MGRPEGAVLAVGTKFGENGSKEIMGIHYRTRRGTNSRTRYYDWKCNCGGVGSSISTLVEKGRNISCKKCWARVYHSGEKNPGWIGHGEISGTTFSRIVALARRRKIPFEVTIEEIYDLFQRQGGRCALTGLEIGFCNFSRVTKKRSTASLDRIDSDLGYTKDNIQWVHVVVNYMKQKLSNQKFVDWCRVVVFHADGVAAPRDGV